MVFSRQEYWGGLLLPTEGIFLTQGVNWCLLGLLHCRQILYHFWATRQWVLLFLLFLIPSSVRLGCLRFLMQPEIHLYYCFPLRTAFAMSHRFWLSVFSFICFFLNFALISSVIHWCLVCSASMYLCFLQCFSLVDFYSHSLVIIKVAWYNFSLPKFTDFFLWPSL